MGRGNTQQRQARTTSTWKPHSTGLGSRTCLLGGCKPRQPDADGVAGVAYEAVAENGVQPKLLDVGHLLAGPEEPRHPAKGPGMTEKTR